MHNLEFVRRLTALCLAAAVVCVSSAVTLALPGSKDAGLMLGELTSHGTVTVNGAQAITGETVFPESHISTAEKDRATISLGQLGRVELSPNSRIQMGFTDKANSVSLDSGQVRVSVAAGYQTKVLTKEGEVVADTSQPALFTVNVSDGQTFIATRQGRVEFHTNNGVKSIAAGEELMVGASVPTNSAAAAMSKRRKTFWILFGLGLAVLITVIIVNHDDDEQPVASPMT